MTGPGQNWQYSTPWGINEAGATTVGGGGQTLAGYRDILDARRSAAVPRTPQAEYPDGYLGNINSRRDDRLLKAVQSRLTQRNYQRGVHKGDKIDASDYFWPQDFNPLTGIDVEARGLKWTAVGDPVERINHLGKNHQLTPAQMGRVAQIYGAPGADVVSDPARIRDMARLLPEWR